MASESNAKRPVRYTIARPPARACHSVRGQHRISTAIVPLHLHRLPAFQAPQSSSAFAPCDVCAMLLGLPPYILGPPQYGKASCPGMQTAFLGNPSVLTLRKAPVCAAGLRTPHVLTKPKPEHLQRRAWGRVEPAWRKVSPPHVSEYCHLLPCCCCVSHLLWLGHATLRFCH